MAIWTLRWASSAARSIPSRPRRTISTVWERTSAGQFEPRTKRLLNGIDLGSETVPAAGDLDADGDLDLIVGSKIDASGDAGRLTVF